MMPGHYFLTYADARLQNFGVSVCRGSRFLAYSSTFWRYIRRYAN